MPVDSLENRFAQKLRQFGVSVKNSINDRKPIGSIFEEKLNVAGCGCEAKLVGSAGDLIDRAKVDQQQI